MRPNAFMPFILFSAMKGGGTLADDIGTSAVRTYLTNHNVPYKELLGKFKGDLETVFLVHLARMDEIVALAKEYKQDYIFIVDPYRNAFLKNISTGEEQAVGDYKRISHADSHKLDSWTYDAEEDQYWAASGMQS